GTGRAGVFHFFRPRDRVLQNRDQLFDLFIAFGPNIDLGPGAGRDRVDAGAAIDDPYVDRYLRCGSGIDGPLIDKMRNGTAESMHGVGDAEIAPAVTARSREHDFKAAAANRLSRDVVRGRTVEDQESADLL